MEVDRPAEPGDSAEPKGRLTRALGSSDLSFFLIAALVNLNSVPVVAGAGPAALLLWIVGFTLFFLPQMAAVLELSHRDPREGGIYRWTKTAFGDFHGFISGWCYWTNNIFYVPTLLFYIVGFAAFVGGEATARIGQDPSWMAGISLALLWAITAVNIRGWSIGKWVQSIGATGTFLTTGIILTVGLISISHHGMSNTLNLGSLIPSFDEWRTLSLLSVVCLNYVGLELGAVVGDEVQDPRRSIPRAARIAGVSTVALYLLTTFALLATIPAAEIGVIDGILQGVRHAAADLGIAWIVVPIAVLMSLNAGGNTSAWLAGSARIPFVIGIDRYLPAALGRLHPRHGTPHVALVVQGIASSVFIMISAVGSTVHDMYLVLLQTTVVLQLIPYLYMFVALPLIARKEGGEPGFYRSRWVPVAAGVTGFCMTLLGLGLAFVPTAGVVDIVWFELKLLLGTVGLLVPAVLVYLRTSRKVRTGRMVPEAVSVSPD